MLGWLATRSTYISSRLAILGSDTCGVVHAVISFVGRHLRTALALTEGVRSEYADGSAIAILASFLGKAGSTVVDIYPEESAD